MDRKRGKPKTSRWTVGLTVSTKEIEIRKSFRFRYTFDIMEKPRDYYKIYFLAYVDIESLDIVNPLHPTQVI